MCKEYGGYLPIDCQNKEYFNYIDERKLIRLNAARYAIIAAYKNGGFEKIWIPVYMCASVIEAIKVDRGIQYTFYNIDNNLEPLVENIGKNDCILVTNYYGQRNEDFYKQIIRKFKNVIFDNTQSFYIKPFFCHGVYNIYSPRKFFGVSDGAYLISEDICSSRGQYEYDKSGNRIEFVLSSLELGCNACYNQYLNNEEAITETGIKQMSLLTKTLLGNIDYETIKNKRLKNYRILYNELANINEFTPYKHSKSPMVYPLLISNNSLREKLVNNNIYVSQWWKIVIDNPLANEFEKKLSIYILPLPIDQRYNAEDMEEIVDIVKKQI